MDPEERRKRHELNYGVYNFRDVKQYFSRQGWRFMRGPELSYDHFYVKPGKNPHNPQHTEGVDYFLGEAALVAYARREKIFGPESDPLASAPPAVIPMSAKTRRRARSASQTRGVGLGLGSDGEHDNVNDSDDSQHRHHHRKRKRKHHGHRHRSSSEHRVGNSAQNPIALYSDDGDEEFEQKPAGVATDNTSGVEEDDEQEEEEEWTGPDTGGDLDHEESDAASSSLLEDEADTDDLEDDDLEIIEKGKTMANSHRGKEHSSVEAPRGKNSESAATNGKPKAAFNSAKKSSRSTSDHGPRPLLKTSNGKHKKAKKREESKSADYTRPAASNTCNGHRNGKKRHREVMRSTRRILGKKKRSAPRSLLERLRTNDAGSDQSGGRRNSEDNSFNLPVKKFGESPPRQPPSRAHSRSRSKSAPSSPATTTSPPPDAGIDPMEDELQTMQLTQPTQQDPTVEEEEADMAPEAGPNHSQSAMPSSHAVSPDRVTPNSSPSPRSSPSRSCSTEKQDDSSDSRIWMDLTQVVLPPDCDGQYHVRVTESNGKPPAYTIWMENLSSCEQRTCSFTATQELPGAKPDLCVPTPAVLTALFRSLSSQPDVSVIGGPEPRATAESKPSVEKADVELRTSIAEKRPGDNGDGGGGNELTLIVAYPALDLFRVEHNFPMRLVPTGQRMQHLIEELGRMKSRLAQVQADRDSLCEQLRQVEEASERALSQRIEAEVAEKLASQSAQPPGQQEMAQRVEKLVLEKTKAIVDQHEKEKIEQERARRWVYMRSNWMVAFHPCQALIAATAGDEGTSLLRPTERPTQRTHVVEWREIVETAESFFQPTGTRSVSVKCNGLYQLNANVSHGSFVHMMVVITAGSADGSASAAAAGGAPREIAPTKVLLYDNKRRVSRVDQTLHLRAWDQVSVELRLRDSTEPESAETWLRSPIPSHNRLMVVVLDEHAEQ